MATLDVRAGQAEAFEEAFAVARPLVAATPGFLGLELHKCVEDDHRYLLLIRWRSVADHEQGFRNGPDYARWKALLHHFYEPFPLVQHYELKQEQGDRPDK